MLSHSHVLCKRTFAISSSLITVTAGLFVANPSSYSTSNPPGNLQLKTLVDEVWQIVNYTYVDGSFNHTDWQAVRHKLLNADYSSKAQAYGAIQTSLKKLNDPYTRFLDPQELANLQQDTAGQLSGIGARLSLNQSTKMLTVTETVANSPAAKSGLKSGDRVLEVDGKTVKGLDAFKTIGLVRGKPGTRVKLKVIRGDKEVIPLTLTRQIVQMKNLTATVKQEKNMRIGYIRLAEFANQVDEQLKAAIQSLENQSVKGFVLDLRENPGGVVRVAANVSSFWLNQGTIVKTVMRNGDTQIAQVDRKAITNLPLVLLVNGGSASASEIVAGALQDNRRAILVGTRTFGKGIVQQMHRLSDGSGLNVTVAHYFTPKGTNINHKGILPDIVIPLNPLQTQKLLENPKLVASPSDPQYQAAVQSLFAAQTKQALPSPEKVDRLRATRLDNVLSQK